MKGVWRDSVWITNPKNPCRFFGSVRIRFQLVTLLSQTRDLVARDRFCSSHSGCGVTLGFLTVPRLTQDALTSVKFLHIPMGQESQSQNRENRVDDQCRNSRFMILLNNKDERDSGRKTIILYFNREYTEEMMLQMMLQKNAAPVQPDSVTLPCLNHE